MNVVDSPIPCGLFDIMFIRIDEKNDTHEIYSQMNLSVDGTSLVYTIEGERHSERYWKLQTELHDTMRDYSEERKKAIGEFIKSIREARDKSEMLKAIAEVRVERDFRH